MTDSAERAAASSAALNDSYPASEKTPMGFINKEKIMAKVENFQLDYRDHSLFCTKEYARTVLPAGISDDPLRT